MNNDRRAPGTGTIETLSSGRKRVRIWLADGERHNFGPFDTEEEAQETLDALAVEACDESLNIAHGVTWKGWLDKWQKRLELSRSYVGMPNVRSICKLRLSVVPFAEWPIRRVTKFAVRRWVEDLSRRADLAQSSKNQTLVLARKAFQSAVDEGLIEENPSDGIKVARGKVAVDEPWTYLTIEEQQLLLSSQAMPRHWLLAIAFAIGTGLRAGEQWNLRLADLHLGEDPHVVVRRGSKKRAPKGRRIRRVPLFGLALAAAREWLALLPAFCPKNELLLAFPGELGGYRKVSRLPVEWNKWLRSGGVDRRVRWHDLRHTCGSSLVSGWWGRTWQLQEVRDLLGHASIDETERYAHLSETALKKAARATDGGQSTLGPNRGLTPRDNSSWGTPPSLTPADQQSAGNTVEKASFVDSVWTGLAKLADDLALAVHRGEDPHPARVALATAVLTGPLFGLATAALATGPHSIDRALELAQLIGRLFAGVVPPIARAESAADGSRGAR